MGWGIKCVHFQICFSININDIMLCSSRDYDCVTILDFVLITVNNALSMTTFYTKKLIVFRMNFFSNFLSRLQTHQNKLNMLGTVQNFPKVAVIYGVFFDPCFISFHILMFNLILIYKAWELP